ncbi:GNAT family N-acetyltransferase [Ramlibacter sp. G-1-2-2]|uniref:GNAT family N-acetyltransferase n=1 Tax=Ramlibacter agri TaxID=2728837 RepID=A0A848H3K3_9BURK|nr:GNAT family N-acetyltransferase [Ramlibacter agri]NML42358.1 GNAT family N-acetyltransferase [Ramlibacter agri]
MPQPEITIRSMEPEDALAVSALLGSVGAFEGTLQMPDIPVASRVETLQRNEPGSCRLVALAGGEIVGMAGLHVLQPTLRRSHVRLLGIAIAAPWQGRGIGQQLIERLLAWADNWAHVLRVELTVHVDNERAIALYRRLGFVEEGRHRGYALKHGRYVDALTMARLHPAPPRIES